MRAHGAGAGLAAHEVLQPRHEGGSQDVPGSGSESGLQARGLTVRYDDVVALSGVSLQVARGSLVAVTGESGAGKTSLLWALAGALPLSEGSVLLDGATVTSVDDALERGLRLMPQTNGLAGVLTAAENVEFPLMDRGVRADAAAARAAAALTDVGLDGFEDHLVDELSGGQQQRVALARLLAAEPGVLLADEPTSALDHGNRERVLGLLRRAADAGAAVVVTTHDVEVAQAADEAWVLHEGVLTGSKRPDAD